MNFLQHCIFFTTIVHLGNAGVMFPLGPAPTSLLKNMPGVIFTIVPTRADYPKSRNNRTKNPNSELLVPKIVLIPLPINEEIQGKLNELSKQLPGAVSTEQNSMLQSMTEYSRLSSSSSNNHHRYMTKREPMHYKQYEPYVEQVTSKSHQNHESDIANQLYSLLAVLLNLTQQKQFYHGDNTVEENKATQSIANITKINTKSKRKPGAGEVVLPPFQALHSMLKNVTQNAEVNTTAGEMLTDVSKNGTNPKILIPAIRIPFLPPYHKNLLIPVGPPKFPTVEKKMTSMIDFEAANNNKHDTETSATFTMSVNANTSSPFHKLMFENKTSSEPFKIILHASDDI